MSGNELKFSFQDGGIGPPPAPHFLTLPLRMELTQSR